jgi:putative thiamine transport system ATP-binding protein
LQLAVPAGAIHTVMGASGSGKSSLLSAIAGTLDEGMVFIGDVRLNGLRIDHLPTPARKVGLLFQDPLLFPHLSVLENLLFAIARGPSAAQRLAKARQALADAQLSDYENADPNTLSGGQKARVALMRALLAEPSALLLDEPFSKLDAALRVTMREFVANHVRKRGIATLMVTHDTADIFDPHHLTTLNGSPL